MEFTIWALERPELGLILLSLFFHLWAKKKQIEFIEMPENIKNQYQYFTEAKMAKWLSMGMSKPKWPIENGVQDYVQNYLTQRDQYL